MKTSASFLNLKTQSEGYVAIVNRNLCFYLNEDVEPHLVWDEYSIIVTKTSQGLCLTNSLSEKEKILIKNIKFELSLKRKMDLSTSNSNHVESTKREFSKYISFILSFIVVGVVSLALIRSQMKRILPYISSKRDVKVGKDHFDKYYKNLVLALDSKPSRELIQLTGNLLEQIENKTYPWKVYILPSDSRNAFSLPGGIIVFHTEILKKSQSPEEILGILAHEMGHIILRHGMLRVMSESTLSYIKIFLFNGDSSLGSMLIDQGDRLNALTYSRDQEREADLWAIKFLKEANISLAGYGHYFEKNKKGNNTESNSIKSWLSSHPANNERLDIIKSHLKNEPNLPGVDYNLGTLQSALEK
jgi:Zn-dependent protease with chaperone function